MKTRVGRNRIERGVPRRGPWLLAFAIVVLVASGCGMTEKRVGGIQRRVTDTRVETRQAPVKNWPVWVFVNGTQIGAYRTNENGECPLNFLPYVRGPAQGSGLDVEFRFQQPDGKVERKWFRLSAAELRNRPR